MSHVTWIVGLGALILAGLGGFFHRYLTVQPKRLWPYVWLLTGLTIFLYCWYAIWRYSVFETHAFDLGIFDQAIWHLSRFQAPASTVREVVNLFGDHFHPIISVLAPLYWLFNSPVVLLIAQAILLGATLPLMFALGLQLKLHPVATFIIAACVALHPGMIMAVGFDFHEAAFAPALFLAAALSAGKHRWGWYWVVFIGLLMTKESVAMYAALLGLTLTLRAMLRDQSFTPAVRHLAASFAVGLVAFFLITKLIIPSLSHGSGYVYWQQYSHVGATPAKLALNVVIHPLTTFGALVDQPEKRITAKYMLASFAGIPLVSWTVWPLTVMTLGERFWTTSLGIWLFQFHYQLMMIAVYGVATVFFLSDVRRWKRLRGLPITVAVVMLVATVYVYVQVHPFEILSDHSVRARPTKLWAAATRSIPTADAISAQDAFVPRLTHRENIYHFPTIKDARWIILDPRAPSWPLTAEQIRVLQKQLRLDPTWEVVTSEQELTVFRRR